MKTLLILVSIVIILISCEKNNQPDIGYDCMKKTTRYNSINEVLLWNISYYKNDNNIRQEYSTGDILEIEFDNSGNRISVSLNGNKTEHEYNIDDKVTKTKYYTNNQLDYYSISFYSDTLINKAYSIDKNNDTISLSFYYYNSENLIDSITSEDKNIYYYYSTEIDSIITMNNDKKVMSKRFFKYGNDQKTYDEGRSYDIFGEEISYFIITWAYNEKGLLIRQTEDHLYTSGESQWIDERKLYDEYEKLSKTETYDENDNLISYSNYFYEDLILVRIESFDKNNNMKTYTLIENNCDK